MGSDLAGSALPNGTWLTLPVGLPWSVVRYSPQEQTATPLWTTESYSIWLWVLIPSAVVVGLCCSAAAWTWRRVRGQSPMKLAPKVEVVAQIYDMPAMAKLAWEHGGTVTC